MYAVDSKQHGFIESKFYLFFKIIIVFNLFYGEMFKKVQHSNKSANGEENSQTANKEQNREEKHCTIIPVSYKNWRVPGCGHSLA